MCGLAGIYRSSGTTDTDRVAVERMLRPLRRRGPDGEGFFVESALTVGHTRLKIVDLSESGRQPMTSGCGRFVIAYNGEIYNFEEIRQALGREQSSMRSHCDTEVLLEAWAAWGPACLNRLVGQFAFAVYDRIEQRMWLARDRFGEKPLFYHLDNGTLSFASSIASLIAAPGVPHELDPDAVREYVTLRYVVAPRTVVKDVKKLAPGTFLRIDARGSELRQWYEPHYQIKGQRHDPIDEDSLAEEFDRLLRQASRRCLIGDCRTALLLSDGIDSNSIRVVLRDVDASMPYFTFKHRDSALPAPAAEAGSGSVGAVEYTFSADERINAMVPAFSALTEPVGDGAALATWLLLQRSKAHAKVFLCGHGADEIFGGYRLHHDRARFRAIRCLAYLPRALGKRTLERYLHGSESLSSRVDALRRVGVAETPAAARHLIHRPLPTHDLQELMRDSSNRATAGYLDSIDALYGRCHSTATNLDRMQEVLIHTFLSENILSFSDSVAMDQSVELRMPFLDRDLVEFALSLPSAARVGLWPGGVNTKLVMRWWGKTHLDAKTLHKPKESFSFGSLRPLMANQGKRLRDTILTSDAVRRTLPGVEGWLSHASDYYRGCWQGTLWALLALGVWCTANEIT